MEKNSEGKRDREEEGDIQKKIDTYLANTDARLSERSKYESAPEGKGLTKPCRIIYKGATKNGYGQISFNLKSELTHRVALMIFLGVLSLPEKNDKGEPVECAHKCNNKSCCEPSHLYLATKGQNGEDMSKNGLLKGEKNPMAKITEKVARAIKLSKGQGTRQDRAKRFGVSPAIVKNIDQENSWAHLPDANGNNSEEKRAKKNKQKSINRALVKEIPWTRKQLDAAQAKFKNLKYVRIDTTHSYNGSYCRLWIRTVDSGYPQTYINRRGIGAHIVACTIGNNYVRLPDLDAAHECGQSLCVNSEHLTFKTKKENAADKYEHGTQLLEYPFETILDIRKRCDNGETQASVVELYSIEPSYVSKIVNMKIRITQ